MKRVTILLSDQLREEAQAVARRKDITLSELIRQQLALAIRSNKDRNRASDQIFRPRRLATRKNSPDLAANHDDYIYGRRNVEGIAARTN